MSKLSSFFLPSLKAAKKSVQNEALDLSSLKALSLWPQSPASSAPASPKQRPPFLLNGASVELSERPSSSSKDVMLLESILDIPWSSNTSKSVSLHRKELLRGRKQKWVSKHMQSRRFEKLIRTCAKKLGAETTLEVFSKLGRENGIKEYNALIELSVETARTCIKEDDSIDQIHKALQLLQSLREQGFPIEEGSYGPLLQYFVDMGMIEEFQSFSKLIMEENPSSCFRIGYYEMLLWILVDNNDKIEQLCSHVESNRSEHHFKIAENYLWAFCKTDRKNEILKLLEVVDVTKVSSLEFLTGLFECFGRLSLVNVAKECILTFKQSGREMDDLSSFICSLTINLSNLKVDEVIAEFNELHEKLEVQPSSSSYCTLVTYCCHALKVQAALDVVDRMCSSGSSVSIETLHPIFRACEQTCDFDLVHSIYSVMHQLGLEPTCETYKYMINLCIKMKDFDGAYKLLASLDEKKIVPTASIYNSIMVGYFREKNVESGMKVLKQMELADVKPDSETFCHLIFNSQCVEDIERYCEEMQKSGLALNRHFFLALINGYAKCGQFDKAKQVVLDYRIQPKNIVEIKSALVLAFASCGQMSEALNVYEEIKLAGCCPDPKAVISLIEHTQSDGKLDLLLQLLGDLNDKSSWCDGCGRVFLYCVQYKNQSCAINLLKQLRERDELAADYICDQAFGLIYNMDPADVEIGLSLLQGIKEDVGLAPSRTSLDFLLSTCVSAKNADSARLIWKEYEKANIPFNVLTFLRYESLLEIFLWIHI
ncbi:Pentatricopeptide repeat-containing protein [Nymphaea thermarum]|nr:Pentatricopeptide repeat-containing protein [Nymphaea thermarum]